MPRIMVQANPSDVDRALGHAHRADRRREPSGPHYSSQLIERISWATGDAEALERMPADGADEFITDPSIGSGRGQPPERLRTLRSNPCAVVARPSAGRPKMSSTERRIAYGL